MAQSSLPRSEERFSRNAETDIVCRLLLEKKKQTHPSSPPLSRRLNMHAHSTPLTRAGPHWAPGESGQVRRGARRSRCGVVCVFFFNDTATTEIYTLSLHDALPILEANGTTDYFQLFVYQGTAGNSPRSEERFSRNAETDLVCRLLLEKKNRQYIQEPTFPPLYLPSLHTLTLHPRL